MRRRDANDSHWLSGQVTAGGRTAIALVCSAAVHAALLFLAAGVALRTHQEAPLIRLSLLVPGGGNGAEVSPSAMSSAPAEVRGEKPILAPARRQSPPRRRPGIAGTRKPPAPAPSAVSRPDAAKSPFAGPDGAADGASTGTGVTAAAAGGGFGGGTGGGGGSGDGHGDGAGPDQRAACVYCPQPHYPLVARARGWQGTAEVALSVLADGSVEVATLWRSSGYSALDQAALAAARHSRFNPPRNRAPLHGRIEYRFELVRSTSRGAQE